MKNHLFHLQEGVSPETIALSLLKQDYFTFNSGLESNGFYQTSQILQKGLDKDHVLYGLYRNDDYYPFYIGITNNFKRRTREHLKIQNENQHKHNLKGLFVNKLLAEDETITAKLIIENLTNLNAQYWEAKYLWHYSNIGVLIVNSMTNKVNLNFGGVRDFSMVHHKIIPTKDKRTINLYLCQSAAYYNNEDKVTYIEEAYHFLDLTNTTKRTDLNPLSIYYLPILKATKILASKRVSKSKLKDIESALSYAGELIIELYQKFTYWFRTKKEIKDPYFSLHFQLSSARMALEDFLEGDSTLYETCFKLSEAAANIKQLDLAITKLDLYYNTTKPPK
jgi:hypothetical protein